MATYNIHFLVSTGGSLCVTIRAQAYYLVAEWAVEYAESWRDQMPIFDILITRQ